MRIAVYSAAIAALLLFPQLCAQSARDALTIWGLHIVPTLFPYMLISKMLSSQIRNTSFPPSLACLLLGTFGGSPSGASTVSSCSSRLTGKMILALCAFTGTISPMFFLGTIASWTHDSMLSAELLFAHISGSALSAACVYLFARSAPRSDAVPASIGQDVSPLSASIDAILQVGGCIILFSVAAGLLRRFPFPKEIIPFLHALLEVSGGMHALIASPISMPVKNLLLAFSAGFSGCSILFQNLHFLKPIGIRLRTLILLAVLRGVFSLLVMALLMR